ncbi:T9SS type A sorting domain-containing protein [bacterium SCSIO 12741]|nr:T9SS type A sorting domain-containing protein [bacterium SCSIO 12741]
MKTFPLTLLLLALFSSGVAQKKISLLVEQEWNDSTTITGNRTTWTYTPQGVTDSIILESHVNSHTWETYRITRNYYKNYTRLEKQVEISNYSPPHPFDTTNILDFTHYADGKVLTKIRHQPYFSNPRTTKDSLIYAGNGQVLENHRFTWNKQEGVWDPKETYYYEYLPDGRLIKDSILSAEVTRTPFNTITTWINRIRRNYFYDAQGVLDSLTLDFWARAMSGNDRWGRQFREEYSYNSKGLVSQIEVMNEYNIPTRKTEYTYTPFDSVHQYIEYQYNLNDTLWVPNKRGTYTYENQMAVETLTDERTIQVFPNPVSDKLTVRINQKPDHGFELKLYSAQGQQVLIRAFSNGEELHLDRMGMGSGFYLYEINDGPHRITTGTLIFD